MRAFDLAVAASMPIYYDVIEDWYDLKKWVLLGVWISRRLGSL